MSYGYFDDENKEYVIISINHLLRRGMLILEVVLMMIRCG